jgi:hypothetical protein
VAGDDWTDDSWPRGILTAPAHATKNVHHTSDILPPPLNPSSELGAGFRPNLIEDRLGRSSTVHDPSEFTSWYNRANHII